MVCRLLAYKRVDVVVRAATRLDVLGTGPALRELQARAGPTVTFHGTMGGPAVINLMESCRAFCFPGVEGFGTTPVEAHASGKPVVAFAAGGALETVTEGYTGSLFERPTVESFTEALRRCDQIDTPPEETAQRVAPAAFRCRLTDEIDRGRRRAAQHSDLRHL